MIGGFFAASPIWPIRASSVLHQREYSPAPYPTTDCRDLLIVLAGSDPACTALAAGAHRRCTLVCESGAEAMQAVNRGFTPDVVLIDSRLPNAARIARLIGALLPDHRVDFIVLSQSADMGPNASFSHRLTYPAVASELEEVLGKVEASRAA